MLLYLPAIAGTTRLEPDAAKEQRGWAHLETARLLCPVEMLDEFDADSHVYVPYHISSIGSSRPCLRVSVSLG